MSLHADHRRPWPLRDPRAALALASLLSALVAPLVVARSDVSRTQDARGATALDRAVPFRTVASTILDSDELLLTLLDEGEVPQRVLSVSNFALEPDLSNVTHAAAKVEHIYHRGESELPLSLGADVVFASPFSDVHAQRLWRSVDIPVIALEPATRLEVVRANVELCARALGTPSRAERFEVWMRDAAAHIQDKTRSTTPKSVLVVQSGYIVGEQTLMDEMIGLAGLRNHAKALGISGHAPMNVSMVARTPPDVLARIALRADEKRRQIVPSAEKRILAALDIERIDLSSRFALSTSPHVLFAAAELAREVHGIELSLPPLPSGGP